MKKVLSFLMAMALTASMMMGVSAEEETTEAAIELSEEEMAALVDEAVSALEGQDIRVGLSLWGFDNQYFVNLRDGAQQRADELGVELVIADPHQNVSQQVSDVENFITMGVDAIILSAIDADSLEAVAKEAMDADIKLVAQSIKLENCDVYSSADEYGMGFIVGQGAGQWIVDNYGEDASIECAVLTNDSNSASIPRGDGLQEGILAIAPNAQIVARQDASTTADGQSVTDALMQSNPDLQVIVCQNDSIALGALSAVQAAGRDTEDFYIGGMDNTEEAVEKITNGTALRASLDNIPFENGIIDVDLCMRLLAGQEVDPRYVINTVLVNAETLQ